MAGKTLLGIGNGARDGARSTGGAPASPSRGESPPSAGAPTSLATMSSGPTLVDDEKVKEGLRRLRSLDSSSQSRAGIDPLAATVARALEPLPGEGPRAEATGQAAPAGLPPSAVRSLDDLVPLAEGGSGPHPTTASTSLVRRADVSERGTLLGRDLHLPPEFGGKGREGERSLTPPRPAFRQPGRPPKLPAGVKPPIPRPSRPTARRKIDEAVQVRSRPNLAARIAIVLTTAAAVALLGVAGIRWHRDEEVQSYTRQPTREWPSSETLPTRSNPHVAEPGPSTEREAAPRLPGTEVAGATGRPAAGAAAKALAPTRERETRDEATAAATDKDLRVEGPDTHTAHGLENGAPLVDPRLDGSRRHHHRDKQPLAAVATPSPSVAPVAVPSTASPPTAPASIAPPAFSAAGGAQTASATKPTKPKGGKDDPDSTLPLDLE